MLQRKQTLYLLAVVALVVAMMFADLATLNMGGASGESLVTSSDGTITKTTMIEPVDIRLSVWGIYENGTKAVSTIYLSILVSLTAALAFATIFLYRKLWLQVRLCFCLAIMLLGMTAFFGLYIYELNQVAVVDPLYAIRYSVFDFFPILALVSVFFAYRGITSDIALLRSLDRIR